MHRVEFRAVLIFLAHRWQQYGTHSPTQAIQRLIYLNIRLGELSHSICAVHYFYFFIVQQIRRSEGRTWTEEPPESVSLSIMLSGIIAPSIHVRIHAQRFYRNFIQHRAHIQFLDILRLSCACSKRR
jgi:hypothetical protein